MTVASVAAAAAVASPERQAAAHRVASQLDTFAAGPLLDPDRLRRLIRGLTAELVAAETYATVLLDGRDAR